jgi:hypothetical protein
MRPLILVLHLASFVAPALALALLLPLLARLGRSKHDFRFGWRAQIAINFTVGSTLLAAGLWLLGRDGAMATYAALVAGVATSQWAMEKA